MYWVLCSLRLSLFSSNEVMRSSTFKPSLTRDIDSSHKLPELSFSSSFPAKTSSEHQKRCAVKALTESQHCVRIDSPKTTQMKREEEDEAECQRKFCALPVPSHVTQPLFEQMMELKEMDRKQGHEERKEFLLSIQKPFSFQEREKEKREKLVVLLKQVSLDHESDMSPHKEVKEVKGGCLSLTEPDWLMLSGFEVKCKNTRRRIFWTELYLFFFPNNIMPTFDIV